MNKIKIFGANTKRAHYVRYQLIGCPAVSKQHLDQYIKNLRASNLAKGTV